MSAENIRLVSPRADNNFYSGNEASTGEAGTIACGCSIYGFSQAKKPLIFLPFLVVVIWVLIHFLLLLFTRRTHHEFQPPAWFIFVSSGHIFIQCLIVIILTL